MGFQESHGRKKNTSAPEGGRKNLAFFFGSKSRFQWENDKFWNFTDVQFATFSVLTDVSFGENEISTDVSFRDFFWAKSRGGE